MARTLRKKNFKIQMLAGNNLKSFLNARSKKTVTLVEDRTTENLKLLHYHAGLMAKLQFWDFFINRVEKNLMRKTKTKYKIIFQGNLKETLLT